MTYFKLNSPDVSAEHFDNEVLIVNVNTGRYYSAKDSAAIYLHLLLDGNSQESTINKIADFFSVEKNEALEDINTVIQELLNENLIVAIESPSEVLSSDWLLSTSITYSKPTIEIHTDMEELVLLS